MIGRSQQFQGFEKIEKTKNHFSSSYKPIFQSFSPLFFVKLKKLFFPLKIPTGGDFQFYTQKALKVKGILRKTRSFEKCFGVPDFQFATSLHQK